jgi:hypothetical protein
LSRLKHCGERRFFFAEFADQLRAYPEIVGLHLARCLAAANLVGDTIEDVFLSLYFDFRGRPKV